ncbi:MAG: ABC transporter permease [Acidobacteriia bacterium]|nr:ABC transporter permease [Terriglobia bacterium]
MDTIARFFIKLRMLLTRDRFHRELDEEMAFHREQQQQALEAQGMTPDEARYAATRQFGNAARLKEETLDSVVFRIETAVQDFRYAFRQLRNNPGFACTAIVILGLGIGATTAIFSAVNPILFKPLPYPDASRILMVWYAGRDGTTVPQSFHTYQELAERNRSFAVLAVMRPWMPTLNGNDQPERFDGQQVTPGYFRALGISPLLGRDFQPADDIFKGPKVVVLSNGLWRRHFGADPKIVGRQVRLDDSLYTVIGVMPDTFENVLSPSAEAWSPLQYDPGNFTSTESREWGHHLRLVGRLRPGASLEQARADLNQIAHTPISQFPRPGFVSMENGLVVNSLQGDVTRGVKPALLSVVGAVILVLIIACVNVTNLLLARGAQRRGEFAMRSALGAAPARIIRQLLTESFLLALLGGAFGLFVAQFGVRALVALSPPELPRINAITLDRTVFAFAFAISALIGMAVGLVPALYASRKQLHVGVQQSSGRTAGGHQLTRRSLVVAEVALALVLLVSAGLLLHSLQRLFAVPPGFNSTQLLTMQVQTYGRHYDDDRVCHQFFEQALDAVHRVPGVTAAAFTSQLPLSGDADGYGVQFEGDDPDAAYPAYRYSVTPDYFATMGIPLVRGRLLDSHDVAGAPLAALLSDSLARQKFPNQDPIGKRVHIGGRIGGQLFTVVGVVGNVKQMSLALTDSDAVYTTTTQWHWADGTLSLVVRGRGDPTTLVPAIKKAVWSADKEVPVVRIATMDNLLAASAAQRRFVLILFTAFGLVALILAATGIYGVLSGSVTERMREIGVRAALGATPRNILGLVVRQGMTLTAIGVAIGLTGAAAASQTLITLLFGVSRLDPLTYLAVIALLGSVSVIACGLPAWRAAQVDPASTLRAE